MLHRGTPYHQLYQSIIDIDPKIRFVTIINTNGRLVFGGQRDGIKNYLIPEDQKKSLESAYKMWHIRNQFSDFIGKGKYAMAEYQKVKRFTFPINHSHFLYITTEPTVETCSFVENILNLIEVYKE